MSPSQPHMNATDIAATHDEAAFTALAERH